MPDVEKCRSCGADIIWLQLTTGKKHIVNAKPKKVFVKALGCIHPTYSLLTGYESHFATCPQANKWRKKKRKLF